MIGWQELLVILVIVVLVFGTKKLTSLGTDLGGALKGFKNAMKEDDSANAIEKKNSIDTSSLNNDKEKTSSSSKE